MGIESFEKITRNYAIEANKEKKDIKKKKNNLKKIKEENESTKKMTDGMKAEYEENLKLKETYFEKLKIIVAETEACTEMAMKD